MYKCYACQCLFNEPEITEEGYELCPYCGDEKILSLNEDFE